MLYTRKKERKVGLTDCHPKHKPPTPRPAPKYRSIKFVLCPYINPGRINGILRYIIYISSVKNISVLRVLRINAENADHNKQTKCKQLLKKVKTF